MASILGIVLLTIGIAMFIEGVILSLFPKAAKKKIIYFTKKEERIRNVAIIETIAAIILSAIGIILV